MIPSEETALIAQAKTDPEAFRALYQKYNGRLYQFLASRSPTVQIAEDLTSTVWEKVVTAIRTFEPHNEYSFVAWIFQIARNTLTDFQREKLHPENFAPLEEGASLPDITSDPAKKLDQKLLQEQLFSLLETLPKKQAEAISLRFFSQLMNKEIAYITKTSEKTVASNLCRGLKTLHEKYLTLTAVKKANTTL